MSAAAPGEPSELDPAGINEPGRPVRPARGGQSPPGGDQHADPALSPRPGAAVTSEPGHASVPARLARALARAGRRAHDAAAGYHRTKLPPFRIACRAPF